MLTSPTFRVVHFWTAELENPAESISHGTHYGDLAWGKGLEHRERVGNPKRWCLPTALPPSIITPGRGLQGPNFRARMVTAAPKYW